jgi:1-phosphofructokinase family hexose kinase
MILTVTPNPCVDKTVFVESVALGTKVRGRKCSCVTGGKGNNTARAVKAMGREACAFTVVGGHAGRHAVDMLERDDGLKVAPVWVASPTRTITTVLEEPVHRQTAFFEPGSEVTDDEYTAICEAFEQVVGRARVVTFNGTVSDSRIARLYADLIPIAKAHGATTLLDTHGPELRHGIGETPFMVKPNEEELAEWAGFPLDSEEARWRALDLVLDRSVQVVALSLGAAGALVARGERRLVVRPPVIEEVNAVGSGDAFVAGFAIGLMEDLPLEETARLACAMGAANAMSWDIGHFAPQKVEQLRARVEVAELA